MRVTYHALAALLSRLWPIFSLPGGQRNVAKNVSSTCVAVEEPNLLIVNIVVALGRAHHERARVGGISSRRSTFRHVPGLGTASARVLI
jgi:hypothetical protein